jgi:peptide/nickel transport system substrate-binding protein
MYKKIRSYFWLLIGLMRRYYRYILGIFVIATLAIVGFLRFEPYFATTLQSKHQIIGMVGSYTPVNLPVSVQRLISLGLTDIDETGKAIPAVAKSWTISDDFKTYTFILNDNLVWHDGNKFTAYDVNYNLKDVTFTPINATTLQVKLKNPFSPLPNLLSKALFKKGLIGLGAYKISGIKFKGENISYLKLDSLDKDLPMIEIKFFPSENAAKTAFKLGEVNVLDEMSDATPFSQWPNITIKNIPKYNRYVGLFFNVNDPQLKTKETRQGLGFAIEKPEDTRVSTPLSIKSWAYTTRVKQYDFDKDQASKLLSDFVSSQSAELTLSTTANYLSQAQLIQSQWASVGVKSKVKVENGIPQDFQVLLMAMDIPSDPDQYSFWHSTQINTNITGYSNPKIDKLLEDGRQETDMDKRQQIYFDFQRYLVEDAPAIFLYYPETYTIIRK